MLEREGFALVSLKPALCEQSLPILLVAMTNMKLPGQQ